MPSSTKTPRKASKKSTRKPIDKPREKTTEPSASRPGQRFTLAEIIDALPGNEQAKLQRLVKGMESTLDFNGRPAKSVGEDLDRRLETLDCDMALMVRDRLWHRWQEEIAA